MASTRTITIGQNEANQRLDRFVRKMLDDVSLSAIYKLLRTKKILLNNSKAKPNVRLKEGDVITFKEAAREKHFQPKLRERQERGLSKRRDFNVVYEDVHIIAVNKPAGLLVHAGDRGDDRDTLIDQVTAHLLEGEQPEADDLKEFVKPSPTFSPGLAHRLDRATSGLVLIGKTLPAMQELTRIIKKRQVKKTYLALALGGLNPPEGTINVPIERRRSAKGKRRKVKAGQGRRAVTHYRVLAQKGHFTLVEIDLETGRTHQIRAHLAHQGAPVVGDDEYGDRDRNKHARDTLGLKRQFLHAARLQFEHPLTGIELDLVAPLWPDLSTAVDNAGFESADFPDWLKEGA